MMRNTACYFCPWTLVLRTAALYSVLKDAESNLDEFIHGLNPSWAPKSVSLAGGSWVVDAKETCDNSETAGIMATWSSKTVSDWLADKVQLDKKVLEVVESSGIDGTILEDYLRGMQCSTWQGSLPNPAQLQELSLFKLDCTSDDLRDELAELGVTKTFQLRKMHKAYYNYLQVEAKAEEKERQEAKARAKAKEIETEAEFHARVKAEAEAELEAEERARQGEAKRKALAEAKAQAEERAKGEAETKAKYKAELKAKEKERKGAVDYFKKIFGKSAASFVDSDGDLMLNGGKCNTVKKAHAVAGILSSNAKVEGWNLDKGLL
eukprot:UC4_evm5s186